MPGSAYDIEHNKQIQEQIENLKKQLIIKNHTIPRIPMEDLRTEIGKLNVKCEMSDQKKMFNIAQYTIFKHDIFSVEFEKIWELVGDIASSPKAIHDHYSKKIDAMTKQKHRKNTKIYTTRNVVRRVRTHIANSITGDRRPIDVEFVYDAMVHLERKLDRADESDDESE